MEFFIAWYSGNPYESVRVRQPRVRGLLLGLLDHDQLQRDFAAAGLDQEGAPQSPVALFILSIFVNIGMWFERFVITVTSLANDFLPSSWAYYSTDDLGPRHAGRAASACSSRCSACSVRFLPMIAIAEAKSGDPGRSDFTSLSRREGREGSCLSNDGKKILRPAGRIRHARRPLSRVRRRVARCGLRRNGTRYTPFPVHGLDKAMGLQASRRAALDRRS